MRSLFARILLWFILTVAVTAAGMFVASVLTLAVAQPRQTPFTMLVSLQLEEAREAYEQGGRAELERKLREFERVLNAEVTLTDASGRDLLTGEDLGDTIREAVRRPRIPLLRRERLVLARQDRSGNYWLLMWVQRRRFLGSLLHPQFLPVLAVAVLLCYLLAYSVTKPVRALQAAVDRFGHGDLSARVQTTRGDELGDLGRTFDRMADRIQTLLTAERRLLLDISHEIRSPLARLALAVELARTGDDTGKALDRIEKESDRLNELVTELLQVTRAEGDPQGMIREPLRLDALVARIVEDASIEAAARGVAVELAPSGALTATGNPELLRRAVENVVRNAIRYTAAGTTVRVTLDDGDPVVLRIRDHGPGVPEGELERIFDPFYRVGTDRNRQSGGAGLGLAIARRAIELHAGSISARNGSPGLEVEIRLPRHPSGAAASRA